MNQLFAVKPLHQLTGDADPHGGPRLARTLGPVQLISFDGAAGAYVWNRLTNDFAGNDRPKRLIGTQPSSAPDSSRRADSLGQGFCQGRSRAPARSPLPTVRMTS